MELSEDSVIFDSFQNRESKPDPMASYERLAAEVEQHAPESTLLIKEQIATLLDLEMNNLALTGQVKQTKEMITRLEDQIIN